MRIIIVLMIICAYQIAQTMFKCVMNDNSYVSLTIITIIMISMIVKPYIYIYVVS